MSLSALSSTMCSSCCSLLHHGCVALLCASNKVLLSLLFISLPSLIYTLSTRADCNENFWSYHGIAWDLPTVIRSQFRSGSNTKKILPNISEDQLNTSEDYSKFFEEFSALSEGLLILSNLSEDIWPTIKDDITFRFKEVNPKFCFPRAVWKK